MKLHKELSFWERMRAPLWTFTEEINLQGEKLRASLPHVNPLRLFCYYGLVAFEFIVWKRL